MCEHNILGTLLNAGVASCAVVGIDDEDSVTFFNGVVGADFGASAALDTYLHTETGFREVWYDAERRLLGIRRILVHHRTQHHTCPAPRAETIIVNKLRHHFSPQTLLCDFTMRQSPVKQPTGNNAKGGFRWLRKRCLSGKLSGDGLVVFGYGEGSETG